jgi:hypothetical protein
VTKKGRKRKVNEQMEEEQNQWMAEERSAERKMQGAE